MVRTVVFLRARELERGNQNKKRKIGERIVTKDTAVLSDLSGCAIWKRTRFLQTKNAGI